MADLAAIAGFAAAGVSLANVGYTHWLGSKIEQRQWTRDGLIPRVALFLRLGETTLTKTRILRGRLNAGLDNSESMGMRKIAVESWREFHDLSSELDLVASDEVRVGVQAYYEAVTNYHYAEEPPVPKEDRVLIDRCYKARSALIEAARRDLSPRSTSSAELGLQVFDLMEGDKDPTLDEDGADTRS